MRSWGTALLVTVFLTLPFGGLVAQASDLLEVKITPQVVERDKSVSWSQPLSKETLGGKPVVVNVDADPIAIRITVTPFVRGHDFFLVVQGDVKQTGPGGTRGSSSLQSLLVPPGVPIAFLPLGREPGPTGRLMVVMIQVGFKGE